MQDELSPFNSILVDLQYFRAIAGRIEITAIDALVDSLNSQSNTAIEHEVIAGAVGAGAATEFSGFLRMFRELPKHRRHSVEPPPGTRPEERGRAVGGRFRAKLTP